MVMLSYDDRMKRKKREKEENKKANRKTNKKEVREEAKRLSPHINPVIGKEMKMNYAPRPKDIGKTAKPVIPKRTAPRPKRSIYTGFDPKVKVGTTGLLPLPCSNDADFRLTPQQRLEKYNQVLNDKTMDYKKKKKLIREGKKTLGSMIAQGAPEGIAQTIFDWSNPSGKENLKPEEIRKASELSVGLQQQLKSTAFGAGVLNALTFGLLMNPIKISEKVEQQNLFKNSGISDTRLDERLNKQKNFILAQREMADSTKNQLRQIPKNNPKYYTYGEYVGEYIKSKALFKPVGKMVEKGVSKIPVIVKGIQRIGNPKVQKLAKFGADILGQQAADTVVNTPRTILSGVQEGKNGGQIGKNVMKQQADDLASNLALSGRKEAIRYLKKWNEKNVVNKRLKEIDQNYRKMRKNGIVLDGRKKKRN